MPIITYQAVENKIITLRNLHVILDSDVAELYQVETKRINEAVKNNLEKFPEGYLFQLAIQEKSELVEIFDRFNPLKHSTGLPKAFTEKGLYMLATILKSPVATQTTLMIIDTFAKARELERSISQIQALPDNSTKQKALLERTGDLIADILVTPEDAKFIAKINDEIKTMTTEENEGIVDTISSFLQGVIALRSRLAEARKSHFQV